jgi:hypothetical protein
MNIERIIWLRAVIDKLASKHHVETHEVEEVFAQNPKYRFVEKGDREGEHVYMALGRVKRATFNCAVHS